jgi:hypothetical protein
MVKGKTSLDNKKERCMRFKLGLLLLFITTILSAQVWKKQEAKDNWGDFLGYVYTQNVLCTGRGSSGEETWGLAIVHSSLEVKFITIVIIPMRQLQWAPVIPIVDELVTISLREGNNTQAFQGFILASESTRSQTAIICIDQKLIATLQRNSEFTILIEGKNSSWHVSANIKGNMPKE